MIQLDSLIWSSSEIVAICLTVGSMRVSVHARKNESKSNEISHLPMAKLQLFQTRASSVNFGALRHKPFVEESTPNC